MDLDGSFKLSEPIVANCKLKTEEYASYPNPSKKNVTFYINTINKEDDFIKCLSVFNIENKERYRLENNDKSKLVEINLDLNPDLYFVKLIDANNQLYVLKHLVIE